LDGVDDSKEYLETRRAMDIVGISSHEQVYEGSHKVILWSTYPFGSFHLFVSFQDAIFRVVAAVLHLGNIEFVKGKETDSSMPKDEKSWFHLKTAAELLMYYSISFADTRSVKTCYPVYT